MTTTLDSFHDLKTALEPELIEMDEEIDLIRLALLSRTHLFFCGAPGQAKSFSIERVLTRITGANIFHDLVFKASPPEALLGPVSIPGLQEERMYRVVKGFLPWADCGVVDEIWNLGTTVLQTLYLILNERRFRNDGVMTDVPLSSLFCSSNILPQQEHGELSAIWDRIHIRKLVKAPSPAGLRKVMSLDIDPSPKPLLTWDQILTAQVAVAVIEFTDECADALHEIAIKLGAAGIKPTPRRLRQIQGISKAAAWLDDSTKTRLADLEPLVNCLWEEPDQFGTVESIVLEVCSPSQKEVLNLCNDVAGLLDQLTDLKAMDQANPDVNGAALGIYKKVKDAGKKAIQLEGEVSGRTSRNLADAWRRLEEIHTETQVIGFGKKRERTLALRTDIEEG